MNEKELIIDIPEMSDDAVVGVLDLMYEIMNHFEALHYRQIQRYYRNHKEENYEEF